MRKSDPRVRIYQALILLVFGNFDILRCSALHEVKKIHERASYGFRLKNGVQVEMEFYRG